MIRKINQIKSGILLFVVCFFIAISGNAVFAEEQVPDAEVGAATVEEVTEKNSSEGKSEGSEQAGQVNQTSQQEQSGESEQGQQGQQVQQSEPVEQSEQGEEGEKTGQQEQSEESEQGQQGESAEQGEQPEQPEQHEQPKEPRMITPGIERIAGDNSIDTAIKVSDELKTDLGVEKFNTVIVARSDNYRDAVSGNYLAVEKEAPILLVKKENTEEAVAINDTVIEYIKDNINSEGNIYVLGGIEAISQAISDKLSEIAEVVRLAGETAVLTNIEVLKEAGIEGEDLVVATGNNYPDALSAASVGKPILLVRDNLSSEQKTFLTENFTPGQEIYVIGGTKAVSESVEKDLSSYGKVTRISGNDRYDTAINIAKEFYGETEEVGLATGDSYQDALVGGVLANERNMPILLSSRKVGFQRAFNYIRNSNAIKAITVLGGVLAVEDDAIGKTLDLEKKSGLLTIGGKKYFVYDNGSFSKKESKTIGNATYYFGNDTVGISEGLVKEDGKYIYITGGKKDFGVCKAYTWNKSKWNIINGIATKVSSEKDKTLNRALAVVAKITNSSMTMEQKLKKCWDHLTTSYKEYNPRIPHYRGTDWVITYANDIFVDGGGNCFSYGAAFAFMAKAIGYTEVYGCNSGGHGWAEVNGLVYDPEWSMHGKYSKSTYYGTTYSPMKTEVNYKAGIEQGLAYMRVKI